MPDNVEDFFHGALADGNPRDPSHAWYKDKPMAAEVLAQVLTEILADKGVKGYRITVERVSHTTASAS